MWEGLEMCDVGGGDVVWVMSVREHLSLTTEII